MTIAACAKMTTAALSVPFRSSVTPAKAGVQRLCHRVWIPACAGMTIAARGDDNRSVRGDDNRSPQRSFPLARHPRESGGPGSASSSLDPRLRGDDDRSVCGDDIAACADMTIAALRIRFRPSVTPAKAGVQHPSLATVPTGYPPVTPAKAGVQNLHHRLWIPACAGMTIAACAGMTIAACMGTALSLLPSALRTYSPTC